LKVEKKAMRLKIPTETLQRALLELLPAPCFPGGDLVSLAKLARVLGEDEAKLQFFVEDGIITPTSGGLFPLHAAAQSYLAYWRRVTDARDRERARELREAEASLRKAEEAVRRAEAFDSLSSSSAARVIANEGNRSNRDWRRACRSVDFPGQSRPPHRRDVRRYSGDGGASATRAGLRSARPHGMGRP
jgi:hypothetical protein